MTCEAFDISCWLVWLFAEIELFVLWVFGSVFDALIALLALLPLPDFLKNIQSYTLPPSVAYYAHFFNIDFGLGIIVTAYIVRFIIRRLPVVG